MDVPWLQSGAEYRKESRDKRLTLLSPRQREVVAETDRGLYEELCALGSQRMLPEAVSIPQAPAALSTCRLHPDFRPPAHPSLARHSFIIHPHTRPSVCHHSSISSLYPGTHPCTHPSHFSCQPSLYALDKPL